MKYATLLLGAALVLASIAAARAVEIINCDGVIVERVYVPTCPASVRNCQRFRLQSFTVSNLPSPKGTDIEFRISATVDRSPTGKTEIATLNGKRCHIAE